MNPTTAAPKQTPIPNLARRLVWLLRYRQSAEAARERADLLAETLAAPEHASMTIVTALYASIMVHYGRIFQPSDRSYSVKDARGERGFRPDVHSMLIDLRRKLIAHMDTEASIGTFRMVGMTFSNGSSSQTVIQEFSAQAIAIAGPRDGAVADAIRARTVALASHLESAVSAAAKDLSRLATSDVAAFIQALRDAGYAHNDHGTIALKIDGASTITFPGVPLDQPTRPIADVAPEHQLFQHLVLRVRPKATASMGIVDEVNANVPADGEVELDWKWRVHDSEVVAT